MPRLRMGVDSATRAGAVVVPIAERAVLELLS